MTPRQYDSIFYPPVYRLTTPPFRPPLPSLSVDSTSLVPCYPQHSPNQQYFPFLSSLTTTTIATRSCQTATRKSARLSGIDVAEPLATASEKHHAGPPPPSEDNNRVVPVPSMTQARRVETTRRVAPAGTSAAVAVEVETTAARSLAAAAEAEARSREKPHASALVEPRTDGVPGGVVLPPTSRLSPQTDASFTVRLGDANALLLSGAAAGGAGARTAVGVAAETSGAAVAGGSAELPGCWDFVDVDPFGSCMPFLEAAVAGVGDGGVLAAASTDLAVLCGKKGPKVLCVECLCWFLRLRNGRVCACLSML